MRQISLFPFGKKYQFFHIVFEMLTVVGLSLGALFLGIPKVFAQVRVENSAELKRVFETHKFAKVGSAVKDLKIAVIDSNFYSGYDGLMPGEFPAGYLPENTEYKSFIPDDRANPGDDHGFSMAQIVWTMFDRDPRGPKIYLLNAAGYSAMKKATDFIVENEIKIVLHAQTYEFGSNFNGEGFLRPLIQKVLDSNVLWINAVGAHRNATYLGNTTFFEPTGEVNLPDANNTLKFESLLDKNGAEIILSWNDFSDDPNHAAVTDLDFTLFKSDGTEIPVDNKIQKGEGPLRDGSPESLQDRRSALARETLRVRLDKGIYSLRIAPKGNLESFKEGHKFLVVLKADQGGSLRFLTKPFKQFALSPNDIEGVISVGDFSEGSSLARTLDGRMRPDFVLPYSRVLFSDNKNTEGTSNAAALFTGILGRMVLENPRINRKKILDYVESLGESSIPGAPKSVKTWVTPYPSDLR